MSSNHQNHHKTVSHVMPIWILLAVWLSLMVLTYLTVAVTYIDLGQWNLIIAMVIATVKASLVVLFFMHLLYDHPFNAFIFIISLAFVALFIILALYDTLEYQPLLMEDYAPWINEAS